MIIELANARLQFYVHDNIPIAQRLQFSNCDLVEEPRVEGNKLTFTAHGSGEKYAGVYFSGKIYPYGGTIAIQYKIMEIDGPEGDESFVMSTKFHTEWASPEFGHEWWMILYEDQTHARNACDLVIGGNVFTFELQTK